MSIQERLEKTKRARDTFEKFRRNTKTEQERAGSIQAFEFCYELSWKLLKSVLEQRGQQTGSPKDTFRKAAVEGLIDNPEVWFGFQEKRNIASHVYGESEADSVIACFDDFSVLLNKLISVVEALRD